MNSPVFKNRFWAILLVFCLVLSLSASNAFAWGGHGRGRYYWHEGRWYGPQAGLVSTWHFRAYGRGDHRNFAQRVYDRRSRKAHRIIITMAIISGTLRMDI